MPKSTLTKGFSAITRTDTHFFETKVTSIDPGHWTEFFAAMSFVAL
jgi:hypothetical protein